MRVETEVISNPFPGLRPFNSDETYLYFGRDDQRDGLLKRLGMRRFVAVVGTSGSGKSSLVRAGLLPALHGGFLRNTSSSWRVAFFRPRSNPIGNMAKALNQPDVFGSEEKENAIIQERITEATLRRSTLGLIDAVKQANMPSDENLLIVVDQFEELFRFKRISGGNTNEDDAAAFVKLLLEATRQKEIHIYVVIAMRSDFLGDCSQFWDLPEAINEGQYLIPRLTRNQRREAIEGPVAVHGSLMDPPLRLSPRLVDELLNDVGDNPEQLPAMQHALMRTWDQWASDYKNDPEHNQEIDLAHYIKIGRMAKALEQHAEEAYGELRDERSRMIAEKLFKALTEKGADNREIRRPAKLSEICAISDAKPEEVIKVINVFRRESRSFLTPAVDQQLGEDKDLDGNSEIDISHESLIGGWTRLRNWVSEEAESSREYIRLAQAVELYEKRETGLLRARDLRRAKEWRRRSNPNKAWAARYAPNFDAVIAFLEESRRWEGSKRRWLLLLAIAVLGSVGLYSVNQAQQLAAKAQQQEAQAQQQEAQLLILQLANENQIKENDRIKAEAKSHIAEEVAESAKKSAKEAQALKDEAIRQKEIAEQQTIIAQQERALADKQRQIAFEQTLNAQKEKARADLLASKVQEQIISNYGFLSELADKYVKSSVPQEVFFGHIVKAKSLSQIGLHADAISELNLALKIEPKNIQALSLKIQEYLAKKYDKDKLKNSSIVWQQVLGADEDAQLKAQTEKLDKAAANKFLKEWVSKITSQIKDEENKEYEKWANDQLDLMNDLTSITDLFDPDPYSNKSSFMVNLRFGQALCRLGRFTDPKGSYEDGVKFLQEAIKKYTYDVGEPLLFKFDTGVPYGVGDYIENEVSPDIQKVTRQKTLFADGDAMLCALYYEIANIYACAGDDQKLTEALVAADNQMNKTYGESPPDDSLLLALNWAWANLEQNLADYGALVSQAALWERAGYADQAVETYRKFKAEYDKNPDTNNRYERLAAWVDQRLAKLDPSGTISQPAARADERDGCDGPPTSVQRDARSLALEIKDFEARGKNKCAEALLARVIMQEPKNVKWRIQMARFHYRIGEYDKSKQDWDEVEKLVPNSSIVFSSRALANRKGKLEDRITDFQGALKLDSTNGDALIGLYDAKINLLHNNMCPQKPDEMIELLKNSLRAYPAHPGLYLRIAQLKNRCNSDPEIALEALEKAIAMDSGMALYYEERVTAERNSGMSEIEIARRLADGYRRVGQSYLAGGNQTSAMAVYAKSLILTLMLAKDKSKADAQQNAAEAISRISDGIRGALSKRIAISFLEYLIENARTEAMMKQSWSGRAELIKGLESSASLEDYRSLMEKDDYENVIRAEISRLKKLPDFP